MSRALPKKRVRCSHCHNSCWKQTQRKDTRCRLCVNAMVRERYAAHKGEIDSGRWWRAHPAERLAYMAKWREKNREKLREYHREYQRELRKREVEQNAAVIASLPCFECGMRHTMERRAAILRRMLPSGAHDIREAWSCIWGAPDETHSAGERMLYYDLSRIGAVRARGTFSIPSTRSAA